MKLTYDQLMNTLVTLDSGVLSAGAHSDDDGMFCLLECVNKTRNPNAPVTDARNGMPDLRPLNDAPWSSDVARTEPLLAVAVELSDFAHWRIDRQQRFAEYVAIAVVREVVSELPLLTDGARRRCKLAETLIDARDAAYPASIRFRPNVASAMHLANAYAAANATYAAAAAAANVTYATYAAYAAANATYAAAAAAANATYATYAAYAAANATYAANAAANAAAAYADVLLTRACEIFIEAAIYSDESVEENA